MASELKNAKHAQIAVAAVVLVLVVSLVSNYFAKEYNVRYTKWFTDVVNRLVDTAEHSAARGMQDTDHLIALQDFTTALAIMDSLRKLFRSDEELRKITNMDVHHFVTAVEQRRTAVVTILNGQCHTPAYHRRD